MTYTFAQTAERVRARVRNLSFEGCAGVCYGVPLLPEQEERLDQAAEKLFQAVGYPDWLTGIAPMFDGNRAYIELRVLPGSVLPALPTNVDGIPIVVLFRDRAIAYER